MPDTLLGGSDKTKLLCGPLRALPPGLGSGEQWLSVDVDQSALSPVYAGGFWPRLLMYIHLNPLMHSTCLVPHETSSPQVSLVLVSSVNHLLLSELCVNSLLPGQPALTARGRGRTETCDQTRAFLCSDLKNLPLGSLQRGPHLWICALSLPHLQPWMSGRPAKFSVPGLWKGHSRAVGIPFFQPLSQPAFCFYVLSHQAMHKTLWFYSLPCLPNSLTV